MAQSLSTKVLYYLTSDEMPKNIGIIGGMLLISGIFFDIFEYGTYNKFTPFGP